ncbi:MAG: PKD domain-containing protein [Saprospiraceae bacterium]
MRYPGSRQSPGSQLPLGTRRLARPAHATFTDPSAYEPAQWHWDPGDGSTAQDTSPVHLFAAEGTYYVCQTVSNANSADTFCQQVTLGLSAVEEAAKDKPFDTGRRPTRYAML